MCAALDVFNTFLLGVGFRFEEGLFFNADRYDLSAVGRMKFNRRVFPEKTEERISTWMRRFYERVGSQNAEGASTLSNDDILAVLSDLTIRSNIIAFSSMELPFKSS